MSLVLVSGQFLGTYDNAYRFGYDALGDDFSGSSGGSFGGFGSGLASIRDPRQNRGKINNCKINANKYTAIHVQIGFFFIQLACILLIFFLFAIRFDGFMQNKRE